jgi:hypothetical protein
MDLAEQINNISTAFGMFIKDNFKFEEECEKIDS